MEHRGLSFTEFWYFQVRFDWYGLSLLFMLSFIISRLNVFRDRWLLNMYNQCKVSHKTKPTNTGFFLTQTTLSDGLRELDQICDSVTSQDIMWNEIWHLLSWSLEVLFLLFFLLTQTNIPFAASSLVTVTVCQTFTPGARLLFQVSKFFCSTSNQGVY